MNKSIQRAYVFFVFAFFYIPLFVVFIYSFNVSKYMANWGGFSVKWYLNLFNNSSILDAAINSLMVALSSASMATIIGSLVALSLKRYNFWGRKALSVSVLLLTASPDIVMGISLLVVFMACKIDLGFLTIFLAHTTLCVPFVAVTVLSRLSEFDESLIEAAKDLGASESKAFWYVLLPITAPAVAAGWLLSFTLSMDDVLISFFVTGPSFDVLPIKIYSMVKLGVKPDVNALSAIMFLVTIVIVFIAQTLLQFRRK